MSAEKKVTGTSHPHRRPARIGIADAVRRCVRKFVNFSGRAPRAEFWKFLLALALAQLALILIKTVLVGPTALTAPGPDGQPVVVRVVYDSGLAGLLLGIAAFLPLIAVGWRRLHDVNRAGWWLLAPIAFQFALLMGTLLVAVGPAEMWSLLRAGVSFSLRISGPMGTVIVLAIVAAWIALILILSRRGAPGPNRFGPNPLEVTP